MVTKTIYMILTDRNIFKKLGVILILAAPLDMFYIRNPVINISLYRTTLIILSLFFLIRLFWTMKIKKSNKYVFIYINIFFLIFAWVNSKVPIQTKSIFLNELMGMMLLFIFINIYEHSDINLLMNTYLVSLIVPIFFSGFVYYKFIMTGKMIEKITIFSSHTYEFDEMFINRASIGSAMIPRLSIPYASPPHLGLTISIGIIIMLIKIIYSRKKLKLNYYLYFIVLLIIFLGTMARSIFLSLSIVIFLILFFFKKKNKKNIFNWKVLIILLIIFIVIYNFIIPEQVKTMLIKKVLSLSSVLDYNSANRHLLLRLEGLNLWLENSESFLVGRGMGAAEFIEGKLTYLAPYFFSPYLTALVERGILGFIVIFSIFFLILKELYIKNKITQNLNDKILFFIMCNILIAFIFYELRLILTTWISLSIMCVSLQKPINYNLKKDFNND